MTSGMLLDDFRQPPPSSEPAVLTATHSLWLGRVVRLLTWFELAVSLLLWVNDPSGSLGVCRFDGCARIHASAFGRPLGVPLPLLGVLGFGGLFGLTFLRSPSAQRWLMRLSLLAGAAGVVLLGLQLFVIHDLCPWCVAVDGGAIILAAVVGIGLRGRALPTLTRNERSIWLATGGMTLLVLAGLWVSAGLGEAPPQVKRLWVADRVNVVEIADFTCPHCRSLHRQLRKLLAGAGQRVHFVLLSAEVHGHRHSHEAAVAYRAADALGKGPAMADALFAADDLSAANCERLAVSIGVPLTAYRARVQDPALSDHLTSDLQWMQAASPTGLPAVWIGDRLLVGQSASEELERAIRDALSATQP